jgi:hypothetical protein
MLSYSSLLRFQPSEAVQQKARHAAVARPGYRRQSLSYKCWHVLSLSTCSDLCIIASPLRWPNRYRAISVLKGRAETTHIGVGIPCLALSVPSFLECGDGEKYQNLSRKVSTIQYTKVENVGSKLLQVCEWYPRAQTILSVSRASPEHEAAVSKSVGVVHRPYFVPEALNMTVPVDRSRSARP